MAASISQPAQEPRQEASFWPWFGEFLRRELAPYPGRAASVARMVVSATLVMFMVMTFQIPGASLAGYYALLISRENLWATWRAAIGFLLAFFAGSIYTFLGIILFIDYPFTHFLWVIVSLYIIFFVMGSALDYGAAAGFSFLIATAIPLWDRPGQLEAKVDLTLWTLGVVALGGGITFLVELIYHSLNRTDTVVEGVVARLVTVAETLDELSAGKEPSSKIQNKLSTYGMVGTGRLRRTLLRQGIERDRRARMSAVVAYSGRLIDLAANLHLVSATPSEAEAERIRLVARHLRDYARQLQTQGTVAPQEALPASQASPALPLFSEVEVTVTLLEQAFAAPHFEGGEEIHRLEPAPKFRLFPPGVLTNHDNHMFALRGWIPACLCYVFYNAVDWPGISTCLATCIITALSNVGSSRQKQLLRLAGAIVGGLLISMPAQIFILPNLDSITGFAIFFVIVTAVSAWIATSSPRLSYFGMQMALAFYLINLQDFQAQTSLTVARDRVMGVLVGLFAMWLIFDRLWAPRATEQIPKLFAEVLRLLARLATRPVDTDRAAAIKEIRELRDQINASLLTFNSHMDAVPFEFGPERAANLELRERMQKAQPALRSIYLLEITLHQYRTRPGVASHVSKSTRRDLDQFLRAYATSLECVAKAFEDGSPLQEERSVDESELRLEEELEHHSDWQDALAVEKICRQMTESLRSLPKSCLN